MKKYHFVNFKYILMKGAFKIALPFLFVFLFAGLLAGNAQGIDMSNEDRIDELLSEMTVKEKAGQMTQVTLETILKKENGQTLDPQTIDKDLLRKAVVEYGVGSILNNAGYAYSREKWVDIVSSIQELAKDETRHSIPVIYGIDAIHGMNYTLDATLFPQQLGQAATWSPELVEEAARITAYETRASAIPWNFSPVLDMGRNPLWPRLWETFGEDVHLATELGKAMVDGYEGDDVSDAERVASCLKHYTGYGHPLSGKDRTPAWIPERMMREIFLPPFEEAIEAGAHTIMINSGEVNGIPSHINHFLLTEVLREELKFKGFAVSDWEDIKYLHDRHKVASTQKEAVKMAVEAGVDMSMVPNDFSFADHLVALVEEGTIPESRLDESVRRILRVKFSLGLFDKPITYPKDYPDFASEKFQKASLKTAEESITLLKNKSDILPISTDSKILITGPAANSMVPLNGGWSYTWQGRDTDKYASDHNTILEAFQQKWDKEQVVFAEGATFEGDLNVKEMQQKAESVDYIVLALGENSYTEKPGDINSLVLAEEQKALANAAFATGKPVILLLVEGRPRIIREIEPMADAVLMAYLPGNEGGNAIANIISGEVNPSGKLPVTYPRYSNDLITYDHKFTEAIEANGDGDGNAYNPQYPFGFGLSYTEFEYDNLSISKQKISKDESITISVEVTNTGDIAGKEVVQLYVTDNYATVTPSVKRLRGFDKINLAPGETQTVNFSLHPDDLAFVGQNYEWITEKGAFTVHIDHLNKEFEIIE
ncbi:MAG: glycoside hydrolase family 3 N-terminal domain-containing protein [Bacteroidota bacterium]